MLATRIGCLLTSLGLIAALSCGDTPVPVTPTPPGPDLEATVQALEARVEALTAHVPTVEALSVYVPTIEDYETVVMPKLRRSGYSRAVTDLVLLKYDQYAAVYMASECLDGNESSPGGFRSFVDKRTFVRGISDLDGAFAIDPVNQSVIARMLAAPDGKNELAGCMRPYLYPEGGKEMTLGLELFSLRILSQTTSFPGMRESLRGMHENKAHSWFQPGVREGTTFLEWMCTEDGEILGWCKGDE